MPGQWGGLGGLETGIPEGEAVLGNHDSAQKRDF